MTVTNAQIRTLRNDAARAGDLEQEALCVLALGGLDALADAEPGTEYDRLSRKGTTQDEARAECERVIDAAAAMSD